MSIVVFQQTAVVAQAGWQFDDVRQRNPLCCRIERRLVDGVA